MDDEAISNGEILRRLNGHADDIKELTDDVAEIQGEQKVMAVEVREARAAANKALNAQEESLKRANANLTLILVQIGLTIFGGLWMVNRFAK